MDSSRPIDFSKIETQLDSDDYESAILFIEECLKYNNLQLEDKTKLLSFYAIALNVKGEIKEAKVIVEEVFKLLATMKLAEPEFNIALLELKANISMASILRNLGMEEKALIYIDKGENRLDYIKTSLESYNNNNVAKEESLLLRIKGIIHWTKGELDIALKCYERSLEIDTKLDDKRSLASTLNNIGIVYGNQGKFKISLDYHTKSLEMRQVSGHTKGIADSLNNIGLIYKDRGDMDHAIDHFNRSLKIYKELHHDHYVAHTLSNIGIVHRIRGNFDLAQKQLEESLAIYLTTNSKKFIAIVLEELVQLHLGDNNPEKASFRLHELRLLHENNPEDQVVNIHYNIALGLFHKSKGTFSDIVKAEEIFRGIISGELINYSKTLLATENLIEILLYEYKSLDQENLLEEVNTLLCSMQEIAKDQQLIPTLIYTLCVRAKLAMIEGDYIQSKLLLQQALFNADEFGLPLLLDEVQGLIDKIDFDLKKYKTILERNARMIDRLNQSDLVDYLMRLQQSLT